MNVLYIGECFGQRKWVGIGCGCYIFLVMGLFGGLVGEFEIVYEDGGCHVCAKFGLLCGNGCQCVGNFVDMCESFQNVICKV